MLVFSMETIRCLQCPLTKILIFNYTNELSNMNVFEVKTNERKSSCVHISDYLSACRLSEMPVSVTTRLC